MIGDGGFGSRHPHQLLIAGLCVMSGATTLLAGRRAGSIAEVLPAVLVYLWAGVLTCGGVVLVAAAVWRSRPSAILLERAVDLPLAIMAAVYGGAVIMAGRPSSAIALLMASAAFGARYWQLTRMVRTLRAALGRADR